MDSLPTKFHYGRCTACDRIIAIPAGTNKVHCCYCGESFLARAALVFYGYQKVVSFSAYTPIQAKEPEEPRQEKQTQAKSQTSPAPPKMMTVRELAKATGFSQYGIRCMIKEGKIPYVKAGVKYLLNYSKICDLMNKGLLGYQNTL